MSNKSGWLNAGLGAGNVNVYGNIMVQDDDIINGKIVLNGNYITTVSNNLYFNGNLLAGAGNVTNVGDWANFPAVANINMNNFSINNLTSINGQSYPPVSGNVQTWAVYPAVSDVNMDNYNLSNITNIISSMGNINTLNSDNLFGDIISNIRLFNSSRPSTLGQFISTTPQTVSGANQETVLTFDSSPIQSGIRFSGSQIIYDYGGKYKVDISIQFDKSGGGVDVVDVWLRQNGNDIPDSASQVVVNATQGETVLTVPFILPIGANDVIEVVMASADPTMTAMAFPAITTPYRRPAIPSIIYTTQILL